MIRRMKRQTKKRHSVRRRVAGFRVIDIDAARNVITVEPFYR